MGWCGRSGTSRWTRAARWLLEGRHWRPEEEIYAANPQLSAMLTTRFAGTVVGYGDGVAVRFGLPAQPPNLHAFVFACNADETAAFANDLGWVQAFPVRWVGGGRLCAGRISASVGDGCGGPAGIPAAGRADAGDRVVARPAAVAGDIAGDDGVIARNGQNPERGAADWEWSSAGRCRVGWTCGWMGRRRRRWRMWRWVRS